MARKQTLVQYLTKQTMKPAAPKVAAAPARMRYDDADMKKPNPNGLYNDQGFMDRVPGQASKFTSAAPKGNTIPQPSVDKAAAAKQAALVAAGNAARAAAAKKKK